MHHVYWNFDKIKIVLSRYKDKMLIFKIRAHFSVTSIALNGVNVRGGNVNKTVARDIGTSQKLALFYQIKAK